MDAWYKRSPLVFPAGVRAGVDFNHPALAGSVLRHSSFCGSGVSSTASAPIGYYCLFPEFQRALINPSGSTLVGGIDSNIGPWFGASTGASTNFVSFSGQSAAADTQVTMGIIFRTPAAFSGTQALVCTANSGSSGTTIEITSVGLLEYGIPFGTAVSTSLTLATSTAYFFAFSMQNAAHRFVLVNLQSGVVRTGTATTAITVSAGSGTATILNFGNDANGFGGRIACWMWAEGFLGLPTLEAWAADPWSFWYPQPEESWVGVAAAAPTIVPYPNKRIIRVRRAGFF